jgi:hypothetical protein
VCQPGTGWADHLRTRTSQNPPRKQQPSWNLPPPNARAARQFRDGAVFGHDFCESLWTRRSRTQPRCTDDYARRNRLLGDALQARNRTARLQASAFKDRSRCPGPRP